MPRWCAANTIVVVGFNPQLAVLVPTPRLYPCDAAGAASWQVDAMAARSYDNAGWWYTNPSEKYESVGMDYPMIMMENKTHVPNHQPAMIQWKRK